MRQSFERASVNPEASVVGFVGLSDVTSPTVTTCYALPAYCCGGVGVIGLNWVRPIYLDTIYRERTFDPIVQQPT